jgi:hypothetical protein
LRIQRQAVAERRELFGTVHRVLVLRSGAFADAVGNNRIDFATTAGKWHMDFRPRRLLP